MKCTYFEVIISNSIGPMIQPKSNLDGKARTKEEDWETAKRGRIMSKDASKFVLRIVGRLKPNCTHN